MCTVSWAVQKGGYRLFFNRDEQRSRSRAEIPREWEGASGPFLGPCDPDGQGTWIGVNAHGWTFALLNYYAQASQWPAGDRSRGALVRDLAGVSSIDHVRGELDKTDLGVYAPFLFLAVNPKGEGMLFTWSGRGLTEQDRAEACLPLSTSSKETDRVLARRRTIFAALTAGAAPSAESLAAFHRHFDQSDGAASVCMRREDAETVSLSDITVEKRKVVFRYFPRDPQGGGFLKASESSLHRI